MMGSNLFWDLNNALLSYFMSFLMSWIYLFQNPLILALSITVLPFVILHVCEHVLDLSYDTSVASLAYFLIIVLLSQVLGLALSGIESLAFIREVAKLFYILNFYAVLVILITPMVIYELFRACFRIFHSFEARFLAAGVMIAVFSLFYFVSFENPGYKAYRAIAGSKCSMYYYSCVSCKKTSTNSLLVCGPPDPAGYPKSFINPSQFKFIKKSRAFSIQNLLGVYVSQGWLSFQSLPQNIKGTIYGLGTIIILTILYIVLRASYPLFALFSGLTLEVCKILGQALILLGLLILAPFVWLFRLPGRIADRIAVYNFFSGHNTSKHTYKININEKDEEIEKQLRKMDEKAKKKESKIQGRMKRDYFKTVKKQMKRYGTVDIDLALQMIEYSKIELESKKKIAQVSSHRNSTIKMMAEEIKLYTELDQMVQTSDLSEKAKSELHNEIFTLIKAFKETNLH